MTLFVSITLLGLVAVAQDAESPPPVRHHYGVRTGTRKLIRSYGEGDDRWELYDLERDPHELENLACDPEFAELRQSLVVELKRLRTEVRDETGPALP